MYNFKYYLFGSTRIVSSRYRYADIEDSRICLETAIALHKGAFLHVEMSICSVTYNYYNIQFNGLIRTTGMFDTPDLSKYNIKSENKCIEMVRLVKLVDVAEEVSDDIELEISDNYPERYNITIYYDFLNQIEDKITNIDFLSSLIIKSQLDRYLYYSRNPEVII